jgi:DNA-binding NarL/FixJ family response regulator
MQENQLIGLNQIPFTFQEVRIILLIKQGMSNQQIAEQLHVAVSTVKTHRKNILKKMGLKGKTAFMHFVFSFIPPKSH